MQGLKAVLLGYGETDQLLDIWHNFQIDKKNNPSDLLFNEKKHDQIFALKGSTIPGTLVN